MDNSDREFLKRIQATFRIEANEHLQSFSKGLTELEKTGDRDSSSRIIETLFREVHSLKGAARSVGQKEVESVCQPLENLFALIKRNELNLTPALFDLFYKIVELLTKLISGDAEQASVSRHELRELIQKIKQASLEAKPDADINEPAKQSEIKPIEILTKELASNLPVPENPKPTKQFQADSIRIPVSKLDPLLLQAEEFVQASMAISQQTDTLTRILAEIIEWQVDWMNWRTLRSKASSMQWNEWYDKNETRLSLLESRLTSLSGMLGRDSYGLNTLVQDHLETMKQLLMLPVSSLVEAFPAMVRDISRNQKKEIELIISGSELEISKRILEELKAPLIHLLRNCIDHGIGTPQERISQNKTPLGTIHLSFLAKENGMCEITISDNGNGIDKDQVIKAAIKAEVISLEDSKKMKPEEITALIFQSGISTSSIITDLSGRGLGLSIVKEKVEMLYGSLSLETKENIGTTFRLSIPMSLTAFRGILIGLGEFSYFLPTMNVERVLMLKPEEIITVENNDTIRLEDTILSLVSLAQVLGLPTRQNSTLQSKNIDKYTINHIPTIVLKIGEQRIAFKVDEIIDEHQVTLKGLGKLLNRVRNISGVTILGNGTIVPVLHVKDLMKSVISSAKLKKKSQQTEISGEVQEKKILVAEDSITSRTLLKNILESAGYFVATAVDGAEAFITAKSEMFDLVVSDVDMPRMNGFELTTKIKNDKNLSEIPVILVTSLESSDDRERGIEAGADAYIIKSRFDQGNLLEVIKRLI